MSRRTRGTLIILTTTAALVMAGLAAATWSAADKIDAVGGNSSELNTPAQDGCPIQSPDGLSLTWPRTAQAGRVGSTSGSPAGRTASPVGRTREPRRAGQLGRGRLLPDAGQHGGLFFVSREALPGSCGLGDIYFTRYSRSTAGASREPRLRARRPEQRARRAGPIVGGSRRPKASCTSRAARATVPGDIFVSSGFAGLGFGPATAVAGAERRRWQRHPAERPEGRARGRLLLEPRGHARRPGHLGRDAAKHPPLVVAPGQSGRGVNTAAAESRPSLSRDARQLLFGRAPGPEGIGDIYVTTRP